MEVNITLILQMLQFGCAYYFLRNFLFAPALVILQENEQFKYTLYKNLEHEQHVKEKLLQDYHAQNKAFKVALLQEIPEQATKVIYDKFQNQSTLYNPEPVQLSDQEKRNIENFLVDHVSQVIKK